MYVVWPASQKGNVTPEHEDVQKFTAKHKRFDNKYYGFLFSQLLQH